jgi:hypothetical protein
MVFSLDLLDLCDRKSCDPGDCADRDVLLAHF